MRLLSSLVLAVGLWAFTGPVSAESIVERVKERGVLYCGGVARPGFGGTERHGGVARPGNRRWPSDRGSCPELAQ